MGFSYSVWLSYSCVAAFVLWNTDLKRRRYSCCHSALLFWMKLLRMSQTLNIFFLAVFTPNTIFKHNLTFVFLFRDYTLWFKHSLWLQCRLCLFVCYICPPYSRGQAWASDGGPHPVYLFNVTVNEFWLFPSLNLWLCCSYVIKRWGKKSEASGLFICLMIFAWHLLKDYMFWAGVGTHLTNYFLLTIVSMSPLSLKLIHGFVAICYKILL